jgi:hypothetical protein
VNIPWGRRKDFPYEGHDSETLFLTGRAQGPESAFLLRAEDESAFDALYVRAFLLLDAEWLKMRASYMEFNVSSSRVSWSPGLLIFFSRMVVELMAKDNETQLLDLFASEHLARSCVVGFHVGNARCLSANVDQHNQTAYMSMI